MIKRTTIIVAAAVMLVATPAISADTTPEHTAIRERNTKDLKIHVARIARYLEQRVRFDIREECKLDRLRLDITTCNRLAGVDRYFTEEENEHRLKRLNGVRD